ncbi:ribonuclease P protein subunit p20 [Prorops nasuta]|uniref:ribonuclease P protein subunit p20 n=1 Tax=Prorops nasuta TaxID=863751 RepID=UPI0034D00C89
MELAGSDQNYVMKKRLPFGPRRNKQNDIYITNKSNFKPQLQKCEKLLEIGAQEVVIHALGAAINSACRLALQLQETHSGTLELDIRTSTVDLIDDFEPLSDEAEYKVNQRQNSAIHIRVYRKVPIGPLTFSN